MRRSMFTLLLMIVVACSSLDQTAVNTTLGPIKAGQAYVLAIQTGNSAFDKLVYEHCYREFSKSLPIVESGVYTGIIEVTFATSAQSYTMATTTGAATAVAQGWYSGYAGYGYATATATGSASYLTTASDIQWQNSTMLVVVRKEGSRVWSADYQYKGGMEASSFYVNTPDEAARLCAKRMGEFMVKALEKSR